VSITKILLLLFLLIFSLQIPAEAQDLFIRNQPIQQGAIFKQKSFWVTSQVLTDNLGITLTVNPDNLGITCQDKELPVKAMMVNDKIYLPLDKLAPYLGYQYNYDPTAGTADVFIPQAYVAPVIQAHTVQNKPVEEVNSHPAAVPPPPSSPTNSPIRLGSGINWSGTLYGALEDARQSYHKVIVFFYDDDNQLSHQLEGAVNSPQLSKYSNNLIGVKIPLYAQEAKDYKITKPTITLLYSTGEIMDTFDEKPTAENIEKFFNKNFGGNK